MTNGSLPWEGEAMRERQRIWTALATMRRHCPLAQSLTAYATHSLLAHCVGFGYPPRRGGIMTGCPGFLVGLSHLATPLRASTRRSAKACQWLRATPSPYATRSPCRPIADAALITVLSTTFRRHSN